MSTNDIGLEIKESKVLVKKLNSLLANYEIYYQNLRNFHWNVTGPNFFELHAKFEELYNAATLAIDETAERILTLGERPFSSFSEYIENSEIKEAMKIEDSKKMVEIVKDNLNLVEIGHRQQEKMALSTVALMRNILAKENCLDAFLI